MPLFTLGGLFVKDKLMVNDLKAEVWSIFCFYYQEKQPSFMPLHSSIPPIYSLITPLW